MKNMYTVNINMWRYESWHTVRYIINKLINKNHKKQINFNKVPLNTFKYKKLFDVVMTVDAYKFNFSFTVFVVFSDLNLVRDALMLFSLFVNDRWLGSCADEVWTDDTDGS